MAQAVRTPGSMLNVYIVQFVGEKCVSAHAYGCWRQLPCHFSQSNPEWELLSPVAERIGRCVLWRCERLACLLLLLYATRSVPPSILPLFFWCLTFWGSAFYVAATYKCKRVKRSNDNCFDTASRQAHTAFRAPAKVTPTQFSQWAHVVSNTPWCFGKRLQ